MEELGKLYGKGFTITNRISPDKRHLIDRTKIKEMILDHYFDIVIYGSIFRFSDYITEVASAYQMGEVFFVDGEDNDYGIEYRRRIKGLIKVPYFFGKRRRKTALELISNGIFFKRELRSQDAVNFRSISFAIPAENIVDEIPEKNRYGYYNPGKTRNIYL